MVIGAVWYATGYLHSLYTAAGQSSALRGPEVVLARLVFAANGSALSRPALVRRGIGRRQLMAASCPGDWGWLVCHWLPCAPAARRPRGLLPAPQRPYLRPSELYRPPEEARAFSGVRSGGSRAGPGRIPRQCWGFWARLPRYCAFMAVQRPCGSLEAGPLQGFFARFG